MHRPVPHAAHPGTPEAADGSRPAHGPLDPLDPRAALCQAIEALERAQASGQCWPLAEAHLQIGRCYRALDALPSALTMIDRALSWARATGAADHTVDLLCELVETLAEQAQQQERARRGSGRRARDRARDHVFEATGLAAHVADPAWQVTVLLRLSDVLDHFGDRADATLLQVRALRLTVGRFLPPDRPSAADAAMLQRH